MLSVKDIMRKDVVTIRAEDSARELARLLADSEISGVPVLDGHGQVVGVASATDLVRVAADDAQATVSAVTMLQDIDRAADRSEDDVVEADPYGFFLPEDSPFQGAELLGQIAETSFDSLTVRDLMTPVTFSVRPDMPVPELCDFLVRGRIHRALVVDDEELLGIVTSLDILKGVADASIDV